MIFTSLDLSKKLHALGCRSVSAKAYGYDKNDPEPVAISNNGFNEDYGVPAFCLEDFALHNDHCRGNRLKIKAASSIRYGLINSENWPKYLEDLLKD